MHNQTSWFQVTRFKLLAVLACSVLLIGQAAFLIPPALAKQATAPHLITPVFSTIKPVAVSWNNPRKTHVFAVGTNGAVWQKTLDGTTLAWSTWQNLGSPNNSFFDNMSVISWGPGRVDLFLSDYKYGVYHKFLVNTTWSAWENIGDPGESLDNGIQVTSWGAGRLDVFTKRMGGYLSYSQPFDSTFAHKWYSASSGWGPSQTGWESLGYLGVNITAISRMSNSIDLFGTPTYGAGNLGHRWWNGSSWQPANDVWENRGFRADDNPLVLSWAYDRLDIFARPYEGTTVNLQTWTGTGGWYNWYSIGGNSRRPVTGVSWGANRFDIFEVRASCSTCLAGVFHKAWTGTAWYPNLTGWEYIGEPAAYTDVAATSWGPNRLDLFAIRSNGILAHLAWNGSAWTPSINSWELLNP